MENCVIIVGLDELGLSIIRTLKGFGEKIVVIESEEEKVSSLRDKIAQIKVIQGDAKSREVLLKAGIKQAKKLIVNTTSDRDNISTVSLAREMNSDIFILSRIENAGNEESALKAGANLTFTPNTVSGSSVAVSVVKPEVWGLISELLLSESTPYTIEIIEVKENSPVEGRTLAQFFRKEVFGILLSIVRDGRHIVAPSDSTRLMAGDKLIVMGSLEQIENILSAVGS